MAQSLAHFLSLAAVYTFGDLETPKEIAREGEGDLRTCEQSPKRLKIMPFFVVGAHGEMLNVILIQQAFGEQMLLRFILQLACSRLL